MSSRLLTFKGKYRDPRDLHQIHHRRFFFPRPSDRHAEPRQATRHQARGREVHPDHDQQTLCRAHGGSREEIPKKQGNGGSQLLLSHGDRHCGPADRSRPILRRKNTTIPDRPRPNRQGGTDRRSNSRQGSTGGDLGDHSQSRGRSTACGWIIRGAMPATP